MRHAQARAGFTLTEMMVAIVILMMVGTMMLGAIPAGKSNQTSNDVQKVTSAAREYLEELRGSWITRSAFDSAVAPTSAVRTIATTTTPYTCTATFVNPDTTATTAFRRRVTLTCSKTGSPPLTFVTEYARPVS